MTTVSPAPLAATILAAGLGSRLGGKPKATLEIGGRSLLQRLTDALREAGVGDVSVVIGPYRDQLLPLANRCGLRVLQHRKPGASLIDSQRLALRAHAEGESHSDLLLVLADLPLLNSTHVTTMLNAWRARSDSIHALMPLVAGVRGHPVLLSRTAAEIIAATAPELGVRDWMRANPGALQPLPSGEIAYVTDVDTPEDLAALQSMLQPEGIAWPIPENAQGPQVA